MISKTGRIYGGKCAVLHGTNFENKTNIMKHLFNLGFVKEVITKGKYGFYLEKNDIDTKIVFLMQSGLKAFLKLRYNVQIFRNPDEAFVIETKNKITIKILEKKEQHKEGSVETKLWSGPSLKREYELILGNKFNVEYAYCVNNFLTDKLKSNKQKYVILKKILKESNIKIFYANDEKYFDKIDKWIKTI